MVVAEGAVAARTGESARLAGVIPVATVAVATVTTPAKTLATGVPLRFARTMS